MAGDEDADKPVQVESAKPSARKPTKQEVAAQLREAEALRQEKADEKAREHDRQKHALDHKVAWYQNVWVPFAGILFGFVTGMGTCASAYFQRDVRNQVWEATYQDKERALKTQSDLLKLQEDYLGKLKQLQEDQVRIEDFARQLKAKEEEIDRMREESRLALLAVRRRYAGLDAAERARQAAAKASAEQKARRERWKDYGCRIDWLFDGGCSRGTKATFAPGTPDEKVVVLPQAQGAVKASCQGLRLEEDAAALATCERYGAAVLRTRGVSEEDIKPILDTYSTNDSIRRFDEILARPISDASSKTPALGLGSNTPAHSVEAILGKPTEVK